MGINEEIGQSDWTWRFVLDDLDLIPLAESMSKPRGFVLTTSGYSGNAV